MLWMEEDDHWVPTYVTSAKLVHVGLRGDVPDSILLAYSLCIPVVLSRDDRVGKYKIHTTDQQYVGFACLYCCNTSSVPGFGRYFPNSYNSFLNGTNTTSLLQHFLTHCRQCPTHIRNLMTNLYIKDTTIPPTPSLTTASETTATKDAATTTSSTKISSATSSKTAVNRPRYGSRKRFYTHVWNTLRSIDPKNCIVNAPNLSLPSETQRSINCTRNISTNATIVMIPTDKDDPVPFNATNSDEVMSNPSRSSNLTKEEEELFHSTIERSAIVEIQDRFLVSDTTLLSMAQLKICTLTKEDQMGRCKDHSIGFIGLCCTHCQGKAGKPGYGRYFPSSLRSLAQADACQQIVKHLIHKCSMCPLPIKQLLRTSQSEHQRWSQRQDGTNESHPSHPPQNSSTMATTNTIERDVNATDASTMTNDHIESTANTEVTSATTAKMHQYGSRRIFFRRIWARLHGTISSEMVEHSTIMTHSPNVTTTKNATSDTDHVVRESEVVDQGIMGKENYVTIPWNRVVGWNNRIVNLDTDRGLISDAQLSAMAQMDICHLTEADQIGWFKNRSIGCVGLCCKHCRGRPSFGRYFPNSVRSLAQTTSSQTIISHIVLYCSQCPKDIRDVVMQLQLLENSKDAPMAPTLNYGSRKVFFDRVWERMHSQPETNVTIPTIDKIDGPATLVIESIVNETPTALDIAHNAAEPIVDTTIDCQLPAPLVTEIEIEGNNRKISSSLKRTLDSYVQVDDASSDQPDSNIHKRSKKSL